MNKLLEDNKLISHRIKSIVAIRNLKSLIEKILVIVLVIYIMATYVFGFYRMKNNTMNPTVSEGGLAIYYRLEKDYSIGDVVMYTMNNKKYVSRIIATAGQVVDIDKKGNVYVDGHDESHLALYNTIIPENSKIEFPYRVKQNSVFVMQDYRNEAQDSRVFGSIEINKLEGRVISTLKIRDI